MDFFLTRRELSFLCYFMLCPLIPSLSDEKESIVPKMFLRKQTLESRNISGVNVFGVAETKF